MSNACPAPRCAPVIKRNYFVNINGSAFNNVVDSADCSRGVLLLTDENGFEDADDAGLGQYLDADDRIKLIPTFEEAARHFPEQSSILRDLRCFFSMPVGRGSRPPFIYVGYVDRDAGETLTQGFQEIIKCPVCFWTVVPTMYASDGTAYFDSVELFDFQNFISASEDFTAVVPTAQASIIFADPFETTSEASKAAAVASSSEYVLSSYYCDVQRNADGTAFINPVETDADHNPNYPVGETIPEFRFSNDALLSAGIAASYSATRDATYNFTKFLKPFNFGSASCATGRFLDETTLGLATPPQAITVTEQQIINATAVNGFSGDPVANAERSVSMFINTQDGVTYVESLLVDRKRFADVWYKERAINDALREVVILFMAGRQSLGLSDKEQRQLASRIGLVLQRFVQKQVINPTTYDWAANGYENIVIDRPGFVVNVRPISDLTQAQITQRNGYVVGACFIVNEPQHRVGINICEFGIDTSQVGL